MADGTPLDRFTEKQIQNIRTPYRTKGLEVSFTPADTELECDFENASGYFEIYSTIALWLSFEEAGTDSAGSQRIFVSANSWNPPIEQGEFLDKLYIQNFTAGQTGTVHFRYRD